MPRKALYLGGHFHGTTKSVEAWPVQVTREYDIQESKKSNNGYGGTGFTPRRSQKVIYIRYRPATLPPNALVYVEENYIPDDEEDGRIVWREFGEGS